MKEWSKSWINSKAPKKQRKYRYNAPLHIRAKLMSSHLVKELREKYRRRSMPIRKGDKVKILRGSFKSIIGEVEKVDRKNYKIYVKGAERKKAEGQPASPYPIDPSNVTIIELKLDDKKRKAILERSKNGGKK